MKVREIREAIEEDDHDTMRQAFRALVDPNGQTIEASSPGLLVVALNRLCVALEADSAVMPGETCAQLELPAGASYMACAGRRGAARLARHLVVNSEVAMQIVRLEPTQNASA